MREPISKLVQVIAIIDASRFAGNWRGQIYECRALRGTAGMAVGDTVKVHLFEESTELVLTDNLDQPGSAGFLYPQVFIHGGGEVVPAGLQGQVQVPAGTIVQWCIAADQATNAVVDVWKDATAGLPLVVGDSITGASPPTLAAAVQTEAVPAGWTTTVNEGDHVGFHVDSNTAALWLLVSLKVRRA
jgi:hypothetical protein